ncbi:MAG TPA: protein kinase [Polyangia bacterium]
MASEGQVQLPSQFGRYTLIERLAAGGMAEVFRAKIVSSHGFEKIIVIKRILPHLAADPSFVTMFIDEAKLMAQLTHPKVVQLLDFGDVGGQYFMALEYIDGNDALALLRSAAQKKVRVPVHLVVYVIAEILDALDYAHTVTDLGGRPLNIVHRDISPSNIFIARHGEVKLGDFGIAHASDREADTQAGTLKGKYGYMSPEQVVGGALDGRSDLFAVGIVLAESFMGRRLFTAPNDLDVLLMVRDARIDRLDKYGHDVPPELAGIVRKALRRDVTQRYQTAAEFRDDLADYLFSVGVRVGPADLRAFMTDLGDPSPEALRRVQRLGRRLSVPQSEAAIAYALSHPTGSAGLATGSGPTGTAPLRPPRPTRVPPGAALPLSSRHRLPPGLSGPVAAGPPRKPTLPDLSASGTAELAPPPASPSGAASEGTAPPAPPPAAGAGIPDAVAPMGSAPAEEAAPVEIDHWAGSGPISGAIATGFTPAASSPAFAPPVPARQPGFTGAAPQFVDPRSDLGRRFSSAAPDRPPDSAGELGAITPLRVLTDVTVAGETGLLRFERDDEIKEVFLLEGAPESVSSSVPSERFGAYLVTRGVLRPAELEMALGMLPHFSGKLGDTLVGLGLMRPLDVFRQLSQQVRDKVIDVFRWSRGTFAFFRGVRNAQDSFPLGLDAFEILGAGALTVPYPDLEDRFGKLVDSRPKRSDRRRFDPDAFRLGPTPREVLALLEGDRTLGSWLAQFTAPEERMTFLRSLYLLVESDLAEMEE